MRSTLNRNVCVLFAASAAGLAIGLHTEDVLTAKQIFVPAISGDGMAVTLQAEVQGGRLIVRDKAGEPALDVKDGVVRIASLQAPDVESIRSDVRSQRDAVAALRSDLRAQREALEAIQRQVSALNSANPIPQPPQGEAPRVPPDSADKRVWSNDTIRIKLARVAIEQAQIQNFNGVSRSAEPVVVVELEITNLSDISKVNYETWRGDGFLGAVAALSDEAGNRYKRITYGLGSHPARGVEDSESIYPGKDVRDVLWFEVPVDGVATLTLRLPGSNLDLQDEITFTIPTSAIE